MAARLFFNLRGACVGEILVGAQPQKCAKYLGDHKGRPYGFIARKNDSINAKTNFLIHNSNYNESLYQIFFNPQNRILLIYTAIIYMMRTLYGA